VLHTRFDSCIRQCSSNSYLVSPKRGVDERQLRAAEQISDQLMIDTSIRMAAFCSQWRRGIIGRSFGVQISYKYCDILQGGNLRCDNPVEIPQLRAHVVANCGRNTDERGCLPA
jgi:hypothetical protein